MKRIALVGLMLLCVSASAEMVTSSVYCGIISYLAPKSSVVKKGEPLVEFSMTGYNARLAQLKVDLANAEDTLKFMKLKEVRKGKITKVMSKAEQEDIDRALSDAQGNVDAVKAKLTVLEADRSHYQILAPYDCKVVKQLRIVQGGVDIGSKILEIEPVTQAANSIENKQIASR